MALKLLHLPSSKQTGLDDTLFPGAHSFFSGQDWMPEPYCFLRHTEVCYAERYQRDIHVCRGHSLQVLLILSGGLSWSSMDADHFQSNQQENQVEHRR